ncbi:hypothetical protein D3C71_1719130 [compost metagenome]
MPGIAVDHAIVEIAAVAVDLAHCRVQVEQVGLHGAEHRVVIHAMLAATVLPALALVAEGVGRHDVLPFGAFGAVLLLAGLVAA